VAYLLSGRLRSRLSGACSVAIGLSKCGQTRLVAETLQKVVHKVQPSLGTTLQALQDGSTVAGDTPQ